jgi:hypothetical protein
LRRIQTTAGRRLHAPSQREDRNPQRQCQFIMLVDESLGVMLISHFGKIIRIDTSRSCHIQNPISVGFRTQNWEFWL